MGNSTTKWEKKAKDFLPKFSIEELEILMSKEKNRLAKKRLKVCILRKQGNTISQIVKKIRKPRMTIFDWLSNIKKHGLGSLYNKKQPGRQGRLTITQYEQLDLVLQSSPKLVNIEFEFWTNKLVKYYILTEFKIDFSIRQIYRIVKKLNFSLQKPRPKNPKSSSKKQEEFVNNVKKKFQISLKMDSRSFVLMKSIV